MLKYSALWTFVYTQWLISILQNHHSISPRDHKQHLIHSWCKKLLTLSSSVFLRTSNSRSPQGKFKVKLFLSLKDKIIENKRTKNPTKFTLVTTARDARTSAECFNRQYLNICLAKKPNVKTKMRNSLLCKKNNITNRSL